MSLAIINPFVFAVSGGGGTPSDFDPSPAGATTSLSSSKDYYHRFTFSADFELHGLRVPQGDVGAIRFLVWDESGTSTPVVDEAAAYDSGFGGYQVTLGAPVTLSSATAYRIGFFATNNVAYSHYSNTQSWPSPIVGENGAYFLSGTSFGYPSTGPFTGYWSRLTFVGIGS